MQELLNVKAAGTYRDHSALKGEFNLYVNLQATDIKTASLYRHHRHYTQIHRLQFVSMSFLLLETVILATTTEIKLFTQFRISSYLAVYI
jgi:hypothetical protein